MNRLLLIKTYPEFPPRKGCTPEVIDEIQIDPVVIDGLGQSHQGLGRLIVCRLKGRPEVIMGQRAPESLPATQLACMVVSG